jgi:multicomponent K+:H+ antiporter subunit A
LPEYHLALWHGFTPALGMSVAAVVFGLLVLHRYRIVRAAWEEGPHPQAKSMFESAIAAAIALSRRVTHGLHNGSLQRYLALMVTAMLVVGYGSAMMSSHAPGTRELLPATPVAVIAWLLLMGASVLVVVVHRQRLLALITVGVVGLIVSVGFVYLSAPDLALTQISVEVVTVVLLLLALNFLPKETPPDSGRARTLRDGVLATLAGLGVGGAAWAVMTRDFESLSGYYLEHALPGGGGTNVVNVILVDFRGYDTFGEIIVLGIAALTIFALLDGALQGAVGRKLDAWVSDNVRSKDRHPLMLVVAARVMLPFALMVGVYIFLRGHNQPGGGFVAGLVVAIALILQYMASGFGWAAQRMKVDYHALIGIGVLVAGATGMAAWIGGYPFLTSAFGHFSVPLVGDFELASAMGFDLGVFLTVVGAVMLALANLSRVGRRAARIGVNEGPMDVDPSDSQISPTRGG